MWFVCIAVHKVKGCIICKVHVKIKDLLIEMFWLIITR